MLPSHHPDARLGWQLCVVPRVKVLHVRLEEGLLSWQEPGNGVDVATRRGWLVVLDVNLVVD